DAEEVQLSAKLLDDKRYGRNFDHDPDRHRRIEGNILGSEFIVYLCDLASQPEHFRERGNHRGHKLYSSKCGGSDNRAQLCTHKVAMFGIDSDSTKAQKRIRLSRKIQLGEGLIATDIHHANDYRTSGCQTGSLGVNLELLLFRKEALMSSQQHLSPEETDAIG